MTANNLINRKKHPLACCLVFLLTCIFVTLIAWFVSVQIAESSIYLKTENISLVRTGDFISFRNDQKTAVFVNGRRVDINNPREFTTIKDKITLKESDDFLVLAEPIYVFGPSFGPLTRFRNSCYLSFYRIQKDTKDDKTFVVKTEFLGSIETNQYGAWGWKDRCPEKNISISSDGKYISMRAGGVDSRSLGKYRKKALLLTWEIGDNVVEKDVIVRHYKKTIPLIIKTEEELESE